MWIESPTSRVEDAPRGGSALAGLFDTHPPLQSRIEALEQAGGFRLPGRPPARAAIPLDARQQRLADRRLILADQNSSATRAATEDTAPCLEL